MDKVQIRLTQTQLADLLVIIEHAATGTPVNPDRYPIDHMYNWLHYRYTKAWGRAPRLADLPAAQHTA